ncbi:unnamed protein product [Moneuplotes crassus]|uniref:RING-type domain-containing protein n=1 Tax=Euplotes crassus TaxID=5936 RepID=A0AAD1XKU5_EUPCR|nr:unnamed protein product [Moneuplotes crassus]
MEARYKDTTVSCSVCEDSMPRQHDGVKCSQGHDLCSDCSKTFVENILSDPENNIPVECCWCKIELNSVQLEKQMTPDQLELYLMYKAVKDIDPKVDKVMSCPFCKYFEIWAKTNSSNFFYCKKQDCKKGSCSICFKEFKIPEGMAVTEDELEEMKEEGGMLTHHKCYEYKDIKEDWDKAIESGTKRYCPKCKVGGVKDDACTHMVCDNCDTIWCYFCGKEEAKLNKSDPKGSIYRHNDDWHINPKRCPMYLIDIGQIDQRWNTENDEEAKEFFHKILIYKNVKKFFRKYKRRDFKALCKVFPSVDNHGFNLTKIMKTKVTLIHR